MECKQKKSGSTIGTKRSAPDAVCIAGAVLAVAVAVVLLYLIYEKFSMMMNSDMSAEMMFSNLMQKQGTLLPTDWYYSTELRLLNPTLIWAPLFGIFEDWRMVRVVGSAIMYALLYASYYYMMRATGVERKWIWFSMPFVLVPLSYEMLVVNGIGVFYILHFIVSFAFLGMLLRIVRMQKGKILLSVLLMALSFAICLTGMRGLVILQIPALCALLWMMFRSAEFCAWKTECAKGTFVPMWRTQEGRTALLALGACVIGIVAVLINAVVLSKMFSFHSFGSIRFYGVNDIITGSGLIGKIAAVLQGLMTEFGFNAGVILFSPRGVMNVVSLCWMALVLLATVRCLRKLPKEAFAQRFLLLFFVFSFLINTLIFLLFQDMAGDASVFTARYYIPVLVMSIPVLAIYLHTERVKLYRIVACVVMLAGIVNSAIAIYYALQLQIAKSVLAIPALEERGYTFGFADFWDANVITEATDGKIEVGNLTIEPDGIKPKYWLTRTDYYDPAYRPEKGFVLVQQETMQALPPEHPLFLLERVYEDKWNVVLEYEQKQEVMGWIGS